MSKQGIRRIQASIARISRNTAIKAVLADLRKIKIRLTYLANPDEPNYSRLVKACEHIQSTINELMDT